MNLSANFLHKLGSLFNRKLDCIKLIHDSPHLLGLEKVRSSSKAQTKITK